MNSRGGRHSRQIANPAARWPRHRMLLLAFGGVIVVAVGAVIAFEFAPAPSPMHSSAPARPVRAVPNPSRPSGAATPSARAPIAGNLASDFARLESGLHARTGVVIRPVGSEADEPVTVLGEWSSGPAWSTIKVPLVIAAMREQNSDQVTSQMTAAITESDNAAAEAIWGGLGEPSTAADKVGAVLREAGDPTTVQSQKVRREYTAFGQTDWSLTNQASFLSAAACNPADEQVLALMGKVDSVQKWGLGVLSDTKIKGGWGPSPSGRYLVRQMGIVPTSNGSIVVAMAAEPDSGTFADGSEELSEIARWLDDRVDFLPAAHCRS